MTRRKRDCMDCGQCGPCIDRARDAHHEAEEESLRAAFRVFIGRKGPWAALLLASEELRPAFLDLAKTEGGAK